jgi:1-acyl-sn-glycerol-3-phosphate acyltransferase
VNFYSFGRSVVLGGCRLFFRVQVEGAGRVPPSGAYIVAPTHRSIFDVPFTAFITKRTLHFLAKDELFSTRFGAWLFTSLGAVRVERGTADRGALRALEAALEHGDPVVVFPEGTRRSGPKVGDLFDGASYLAVKLGVPIVPVGVGGSEFILPKGKVFPRPHRVAVVVGEPIVPPVLEGRVRRSAATQLTRELAGSLQRCFDRALDLAGD